MAHLDCCLSLFIDCLPQEISERIIINTIERMHARKPIFDSSKQGDLCTRLKRTFLDLQLGVRQKDKELALREE